MTEALSRSEKKRRAKAVEGIAGELAALPARDIDRLPCEAEIREEIHQAQGLKGGAHKRQVKYITRLLRDEPLEELLQFLQEKKGSKLRRDRELHESEHARDRIINEAIRLYEEPFMGGELLEQGQGAPEQPPLPTEIQEDFQQNFNEVDVDELWRLAWRFARTRQVSHSREIFRILKAAKERQRFVGKRSAAPHLHAIRPPRIEPL